MPTSISLDYESFSMIDLPTVGAWRYAQHESTRLLCYGWAFDDDEPTPWWPGCVLPRDFYDAIKKGVPIWGWNVNFERAMTECVAGPQHGMPIPKPSQWRDTQALALTCSLPVALGNCAAVLKIDEQKDKEGKRLLDLFSVPASRTGKVTMPEDAPEEFKKLVKYCLQDVRTERAVRKALPIQKLPGIEQKVWTWDSEVNRRGVYVDRRMARGAVKIVRDITPAKLRELKRLTVDLEDPKKTCTTPGQVARIKAWVNSRLPKADHLKSLEKRIAEPYLTRDDIPDDVKTVLGIRLMMGKAAVTKFTAALIRAGKDGRVRGIARYHKAHTGRWGGEGLQGQNLARPSEDVQHCVDAIRRGDTELLEKLRASGLLHKGDAMSVLRDSIRHLVQAAPGKTLVVGDLAAIEGRVNAWQAGEEWKLEAYRKGLDLYLVTAGWIYNVPLNDFFDDNKELKKSHKPLRQMGKESELGLGYSMAWATFKANCEKKGIKNPEELYKKCVKIWRKKNPRIVQSWYDLESAALRTVMTKERTRANRFISFEMVGTYLTMILPSGRRLWYPEARVEKRRLPWGEVVDQVTFKTWMDIAGGKWLRDSTYGGKLVENAVQAIARDVLVHGLLLAESRGYPIVMHVHDEGVAEVTPDKADLKGFLECLSTVPSWAPGLPLGAAGFVSRIYKKD